MLLYLLLNFICDVLSSTSNLELYLMTSKLELNLLSFHSHLSQTHMFQVTPTFLLLTNHNFLLHLKPTSCPSQNNFIPVTYFLLIPSPDLLIQVMPAFWLSFTTKEEPIADKSVSSTLTPILKEQPIWCSLGDLLSLSFTSLPLPDLEPFQSFKVIKAFDFHFSFNPFNFHTHTYVLYCNR